MNQVFFPIGRSVYNGLQVGLKSNLKNPMPGVRNLNMQVGYALARYKATALDTDFITGATDFDNPNKFFGPNGLDRTHQLTVGTVMDLPGALRFSTLTHWATALPATLTLPRAVFSPMTSSVMAHLVEAPTPAPAILCREEPQFLGRSIKVAISTR